MTTGAGVGGHRKPLFAIALSLLSALNSRALVRNVSSLFGTTMVTSLLGFVFWTVAARLSDPSAFGSASVAISAMQLAGSLATLGLGTLLLGELARRPEHPWRLVGGALAISGTAGVVSGIVTAVALGLVSDHPLSSGGAGPAVLFVGGCAVTTVTMVLDYALIGLSKSGPQLTRNIIFSVAKLLLLPVIAMTAGLGATGIYGAWFLGHLISLIPLAARANHSIWPELVRPGMVLKGLGRSALAHHVTNTSSYAPVLVLPVVVAARLGTEANAAFYAATLLISSAWVITTHLATALFASAGAAPKDFARDLRFSLRISGTVAALTVLTAAPLAGPLLALFGAEYTRAQAGLVSLALATPFVSVKPLYIAVCRAEGQLRLGARVALIASFVEITAGAVGTLFGLTGTCAFFAVANFLEALVLWPRVARYAGLTIRSSRRPASWTPPEPPTAQD